MTTSLDLTPYSAVQQSSFVKIRFIEDGVPVIVRMSSYEYPISLIEGDGNYYLYSPIGNLLSITDLTNEVKSSQSDVTITMSGISPENMGRIIQNPVKGAPVEIRRMFFNANTGQPLTIAGNPVLEFSGVVSNFSVDEGWSDPRSQTITTTISLACSSIMSLLSNKVSGRRTNQADQSYWYSGDLSMNRVSVIADSIFDFGGTTPTNSVNVASPKTVTIG